MSYILAILRTKKGSPVPLTVDEAKALPINSSDIGVEPPSLKGAELDVVVERGEKRYRFILQNGELWTKNPDEYEIEAMLYVAGLLGARVRGDELETYRTPTDTYAHEDDRDLLAIRNAERGRLVRRRNVVPLVIKLVASGVFLVGFVVMYMRSH